MGRVGVRRRDHRARHRVQGARWRQADLAPALAATTLLIFIAAWAIVTGVFEIVHAIRVRKGIDNEWLLILSGVLSVAVGFYMLSSPAGGALAIVWVIAAWSILFGVLLCSAAIRLKKARDAKA